MHRWTDGSLAKHLSDLQARHYEDSAPAQDGEVKVLLSSIWPEADLVEGLQRALRGLVTAVGEYYDREEFPHHSDIMAAVRVAGPVLEAAERWADEEK
jgi:hypothetical protein